LADLQRSSLALQRCSSNVANPSLVISGKYSTKLTVGSFDNFVKEQVDSGKTLFVRWIASEG